jgi:hypothetical protein
MSKRLNKRQQREQEELEQLRAVEKQSEHPAAEVDDNDESEVDDPTPDLGSDVVEPSEPVNAFAAVSWPGGDYRGDR